MPMPMPRCSHSSPRMIIRLLYAIGIEFLRFKSHLSAATYLTAMIVTASDGTRLGAACPSGCSRIQMIST
jgi:hypothetical protein